MRASALTFRVKSREDLFGIHAPADSFSATSVEAKLARLVHGAHAASADFLQQFIIIQLTPDGRQWRRFSGFFGRVRAVR